MLTATASKSQIAIEYSYRQKERSPDISTFWVHASSKARFEQSFAQIATTAGIQGSGDGKVDILQVVSTWLQNPDNGPWLLILDNADDATVLLDPTTNDTGTGAVPVQRCLVDFLPRVQHGAILITTRDRSCALSLNGDCGTPVEVKPMTMVESVRLLRTWLPEALQEDASELVKELENLPLAISQASAYIKRMPRVSILKYLEIFRGSKENQIALLNKNREDLRRDRGVPNAVITSWELSFDQIRRDYPDSANLLSLMSYFNRQQIPQFLLKGDFDDISFEEDLNVLLSFPLIRAEIREDTFEMHRLVQIAMQHWLCNEGKDQLWKDCAVQRVAHLFPEAAGQENHWPLCEALMSHAEEVLLYTASAAESELARAAILVCTACYSMNRKGNNGVAERRATDAVQIQRRHFEDNSHETVLNTLEILAHAQNHLSKFREAISLREAILKQRLEKWGPEDSNSLIAMHNLALSHKGMGHFEKAEDLLNCVIEADESLSGPESRLFFKSGIELADVYLKQGRYEEAEKLGTKVLETCRNFHGLEHVDTLNAMSSLSWALIDNNKLEGAEHLMIEALPLFTKNLGPTHWRILQARTILGDIYLKQSRLDEAKQIILSCLDTEHQDLGPSSTIIARLMNLLGLIFSRFGEITNALKYLKDAVELYTEVYGINHPETLISMYNLAVCYHDMGDNKSAIPLMTEVLEKQREVLAANHPDITDSAEILADWESEDEDSEECETAEEGSDEEEVEEEEGAEDGSEEEGSLEDGSEEGGIIIEASKT